MRWLAPLPLATAVALGGPAPVPLDPVEITEWHVPWEGTRPRDPDLDAENRVWFVGQQGDYVAYLDPASGQFQRFDLDQGSGPHNLIVDPRGSVWYAANRAAHIGRLDPRTGNITKFPMPDRAASDPHTLVFDHNGDIWFTVQGGNFVGRLATATGTIDLLPVPTPGARPYGIVIDGRNRPWIAEFGSNRLAMVDPTTLALTEIALPRVATRPRRLEVTSDGAIWYVDYAGGMLGRYDPASGETREWLVPGGKGARPYGMAVDDRDHLWFVETGLGPNRFVGFDPATEAFFSVTNIGSGGGAVRHMVFHPATRTVWFGTDTNTIGRARLP